MDPVHDRGSMDPVQSGGPWTPGPCFVLTHKFVIMLKRNSVYVHSHTRPLVKSRQPAGRIGDFGNFLNSFAESYRLIVLNID